MKKVCLFLFFVLLLVFSFQANAELILRGTDSNGYQLIYDTDFFYKGNYYYAIAVGDGLNGQFSSTPQKLTTKEPTQQTKTELTTLEHLNKAKEALDSYKPNKDPMKTSWGNVTLAEEHLKAIKSYDNNDQEKEAQKLWKEIEWRKKEIDKVAKVVAKQRMIEERKNLRNKLDERFQKNRMDVKVMLEGREKDILRLRYVLWDRASMYHITNRGDMSEGSFLSNLKKAGFRKVCFDNNYDFNRCYDLSK